MDWFCTACSNIGYSALRFHIWIENICLSNSFQFLATNIITGIEARRRVGALHLIGHCFGRPGVNTVCSVCDANPIFGRATWAASIRCYPLVFSERVGTCSRKTWCDARANKNTSAAEIGPPASPHLYFHVIVFGVRRIHWKDLHFNFWKVLDTNNTQKRTHINEKVTSDASRTEHNLTRDISITETSVRP